MIKNPVLLWLLGAVSFAVTVAVTLSALYGQAFLAGVIWSALGGSPPRDPGWLIIFGLFFWAGLAAVLYLLIDGPYQYGKRLFGPSGKEEASDEDQ